MIEEYWPHISAAISGILYLLVHIAPHINDGEYTDEVSLARKIWRLITGNYRKATNVNNDWAARFGKLREQDGDAASKK